MAYESMSFNQETKFNNEAIAFILAICAAFLCQLIGCVTQGWYVWESDARLQMGLWYTLRCEAGACTKTSTLKFFKEADRNEYVMYIKEMQAMTMIGIILCLVGMIGVIVFKTKGSVKATERIFVIAVISVVASGSLALASAGKAGFRYHTEYRHFQKYDATLFAENPYRVPYSIILTGLGGMITPFTICLLLWMVCKLHDNMLEIKAQDGCMAATDRKY